MNTMITLIRQKHRGDMMEFDVNYGFVIFAVAAITSFFGYIASRAITSRILKGE